MSDDAAPRNRKDKMNQVLAALSEREREALYRFYVLHQTSAEVSRDLSITEEELRKLRRRVRRAFAAARAADESVVWPWNGGFIHEA
jgi:DNA-directed RNA polymerase specialized sigma24 family protein